MKGSEDQLKLVYDKLENLPLERVILMSRKGRLPFLSSSDEKKMLGCWRFR